MNIIIKILKKLLKYILLVIGFYVIAILLLWIWCAQPFFFHPEPFTLDQDPSPERLKHYVKVISETYSPRSYKDTEHLEELIRFMTDEFEKYSDRVTVQTFSVEVPDYTPGSQQTKRYSNISALYGPNTKERIVIGAHYDAFHTYPGADDNASGVAGLLELGQILKKRDDLPFQVETVAYALEEPPFFGTEQMGSAVHAKHLKDENTHVKLMITLEMIGYYSEKESSQDFPMFIMQWFYPTRGNFICVVSNLEYRPTVLKVKKALLSSGGIDVYSIAAPALLPGIDFSDHRNYWKHNYPAVMITDTAFYRNPFYHTSKDTYETLDYKKMAEVLKGVMAVIYSGD